MSRRGLRAWLGIVGLLALIPIGCGPKGETAAGASTAVPPVPTRVGPIEPRDVERTIEVVGNLRGWDEVTVGAKRAGRVMKIVHDMGDRVSPGEVLVELEMIDSDLAIAQAQKRLEADLSKLGLTELPKGTFDLTNVPSVVQSRLAHERTKMNLGRARALMSKGVITPEEFQNADNDERAAQAALDNATLTAQSTLATAQASRVAIDVARQARVDLVLRAPTPSTPPEQVKSKLAYAITRRVVSEGQMVREGDPMFDLTIENPLRVWCNVPERYSSVIKLGQETRLRVASHPGETFPAKVTKINPSVDRVSRTFQVEAYAANDDGRLRPGGFAKASIVVQRNDETITVPSEAIDRFGGTPKIYVIDADKKARVVKVEIGVEGPGWCEVRGADVPRQGRVALEGHARMADGSLVTIKAPVEDAAKADAAANQDDAKDAPKGDE